MSNFLFSQCLHKIFRFKLWIVNALPNDKILDWSKLKAVATDNLKVVKMMIYVLDRVENIVGKGENAGYQCFHKPSCRRSLKVGIVCKRGNM